MNFTKARTRAGAAAAAGRDDDRLLRIYLQDHYAGSVAGLARVRRSRRANPDLDGLLGDIERAIIEDRHSLESIMSRLGVRQNTVKNALAAVAEVAGRLKSNGRLFRQSPSTAVVELELLAAAVLTKRNLWHSLLAIAGEREGLDAATLQNLIARATSQLEQLVAAHGPAAHRAFATGTGVA